MISVEQIKALRDETGISIAQCKKALEDAGGDAIKALESLKETGAAILEKKANRSLGAGRVAAYLHSNGALGALVELDCETDFVAKNPEFQALANDLAMQVAAFAPADLTELLAQPFVKDQTVTTADIIKNSVQKFGERIEVIQFSRFVVEA